jgi:hypothetical protein
MEIHGTMEAGAHRCWVGFGRGGWRMHTPLHCCSPKHYKLLVVRNPRDTSCACASAEWKNEGRMGLDVHQFPPGYHSGSTDSPVFLEMLVLILLVTLRAGETTASVDRDARTHVKVEGVAGQHTGSHRIDSTPNKNDPPSATKAPRRRSDRHVKDRARRARPASRSTRTPNMWFVPPDVLETIDIPDKRTAGK